MEMTRGKIRVVVAEDEEPLLEAICERIASSDSGFKVVAACSDGETALKMVQLHSAQVVFTDIRMPRMDGLELARQLSLRYPEVKVVILSGYSDFSYTRQAIKCGVFNYLLKPLEAEALCETLDDLKRTITTDKQWKSIKTRYSESYQRLSGQSNEYALFIVNFGNYIYEADDEVLNDFFYQKMAGLFWHSIMQQVFPEFPGWYVADEDRVNKKTICLLLQNDRAFAAIEKAELLCQVLQQSCPELSINICASTQRFDDGNVWLCAQRMRNILKQRIVLARGSQFTLEQDETLESDDTLRIVKLRIHENFREYIEQGDIAGAEAELHLILGFMLKNNITQQDFQRIVVYVLRMIEFMPTKARASVRDNWQMDILRCLCEQNQPEQLVEHLLYAIRRCFLQGTHVHEDDGKLSERLIAHVDEYYLTLNNLDDITNTFFYSYEYLARLFKKRTGLTMSRYVLKKRMELAKRLIDEHEQWNVGQIARLCGYEDARYFSRLFKSYTNMTPTEYKGYSAEKIEV